MLRINLLPPEVLDRRRYERYYPPVLFGFTVLLLVILMVYGYLWLSGAQKNANLQLLQEQSQKLQAQADAFGVFERKEQDLATRQGVGTTALANRLDMGRICEEVSLVLPEEVWLQTLGLDQTEGLTLSGYTPSSTSHTMDVGYKSVAKTLVRLNELQDVSDVWLTTATDTLFTGFVPTATGSGEPVVNFSIKGQVSASTATASGQK